MQEVRKPCGGGKIVTRHDFEGSFVDKQLTYAAQSDKGPESYPEPEEDYVEHEKGEQ